MNNFSEGISEKICSVIMEKFTPVLFQKIDSLIEFINAISDLRESFPDYNENLVINNLEKVKEITDELNSLINQQFPKKTAPNFDQFFPSLRDSVSNIIGTLDTEVKSEQSDERFRPVSDDKRYIKALKKIKSFTYLLYTYYLKSVNFISLKLGKKTRTIRYWVHTIPLQNLGLYYLREELLKQLSGIYEVACRSYSKAAISVWTIDKKYDHYFINNFIPFENRIEIESENSALEELVKELEDFKNEIEGKIKNVIEECIYNFNSAYEKAGTIELWRMKFSDKRIAKAHKRQIYFFEKTIEEWDNNHFALGEDWKLNCNLQSARYSALRTFFKFDKALSIKLKIQILPPFYDVASVLENILHKISEEAAGSLEFASLLKAVKGKIQEELLSSTLPGLIVTVSEMQIPEMIDNAEREINDIIESMPTARVLINTGKYNLRVSSDQLERVFPKELITFNALPVLKETFSKVKSYLLKELENVQAELVNFGNIVDFSIESAISALNSKELTENEVKETVLEGIKLSYEKNEEIKNIYLGICKEVSNEINKSTVAFNEEVFSFANVSNINNVRVQLERAEAKIKAQREWNKTYSSVKNFAPMLLKGVIKYFRSDSGVYPESVNNINSREKFSQGSNEVREYLSTLNSSVEKIPYIYRRLFQIKPLENERLYVQRKEEEMILHDAFSSWKNGNYAPVVLTSDKGDGVSTFINIVVSKLGEEINLSRINIRPTINTEEKLLRLFNLILNTDTLTDHYEHIKIFNSSKTKRIIVIENLHHAFLKTVGGFKYINMLLEIISKTNNNVFWIITLTNYAFEYLRKSIKINDHFAYHIKFNSMNNKKISELIKKRNSISGYALQYEKNISRVGNKEFTRLTEHEAQKLLEKDFFNSLSKYVQSNISLALLFWIRSIQEMKDRTLFIKKPIIDRSILNSLSPEKVFILHSLVLHDGLKSEEIQKTVNYSFNKTILLLQVLSDDGIVIKEDDTFFINPLLYTQTIELLKSKNFLD